MPSRIRLGSRGPAAFAPGGNNAADRQHDKGKLTARERLDILRHADAVLQERRPRLDLASSVRNTLPSSASQMMSVPSDEPDSTLCPSFINT